VLKCGFFFQAEDGIRDRNVTGVQTCALPILTCGSERAYTEGWFTPQDAIVGGAEFIGEKYISVGQDTLYKMRWNPANPATHQYRSEERRVGKECRYRWTWEH